METVVQIIHDIFRAIGIAYYGLASQLGYFERGMIIVLFYSSVGVWAYFSTQGLSTKYFLDFFQEKIAGFFKDLNFEN